MKLYALLCGTLLISCIDACNRRPQGASGDRTPVNENFQILIDGNPPTYIPGQQYNISISCTSVLKFISFTLVVESENSDVNGYDVVGHFELIDSTETRFSLLCENMVESTNTNSKSRTDVSWVAPTNPSSGCVLIKAAVLQHRNVWFIDDGFLTKRICPEEIDEINSQTPLVNPCCACDEAKYEIMLKRKWTRNTHPRDFPAEAWRTRLSEIIGASHSVNYKFWEYGSRASRGLQEMAEHGATATLEQEIKSNINSGDIRTIIKAPGIIYRNNVMGTTLANVRVDPTHHLISLVSKLEPSPDWILGVAGLELCLSNCTWIDNKILNLYPWDVGTDAGPTYLSPDQPQVPPDVIRRITSSFPSDYRSPFYDDTGAPIKPLATLFITRKKLYERICDTAENQPFECATHPWTAWTDCSTKCGPGTQSRSRSYKDQKLAESFNCEMELLQTQNCLGSWCGMPDEDHFNSPAAPECALTDWTDWGSCSTSCGKGFATRTRNYIYPYAREKCQSIVADQMEQTQTCFGNDCGGGIRNDYNTQYGTGGLIQNNEDHNVIGEDFENQDRLQNYGNVNAYNMPDTQSRHVYPSNEFRAQSLVQPSSSAENFESYNPRLQYGRQNIGERSQRTNFITPQPPKYSIPTMSRKFQSFREESKENQRLVMGDQNTNFGSKNVMFQRADLNQYPVVQKFCFKKPTYSMRPCSLPKVFNRNYWFFDADDTQCKLFTADNCDDNKNKFGTLESCEDTCKNPIEILRESQQDIYNPELEQQQPQTNQEIMFY